MLVFSCPLWHSSTQNKQPPQKPKTTKNNPKKAVATNQDGDHAYVRISFHAGGANYEPAARFPDLVFLKELSFRTSDVRHASKVVQDIKLLRSAVQTRDKERAERATLVAQEKLVRGKKVFRLPDLWVRPSFGGRGRKLPGVLEAHHNGFRYSTPKGESCFFFVFVRLR